MNTLLQLVVSAALVVGATLYATQYVLREVGVGGPMHSKTMDDDACEDVQHRRPSCTGCPLTDCGIRRTDDTSSL